MNRKLKAITLSSIGKLRQFTNDTLIDVLFYGSPAYAQVTIVMIQKLIMSVIVSYMIFSILINSVFIAESERFTACINMVNLCHSFWYTDHKFSSCADDYVCWSL